jgi:tetratricopeptide (TPR) repeat protein
MRDATGHARRRAAAAMAGLAVLGLCLAGCGSDATRRSGPPAATRAEDLLALADSAMTVGAYGEALEAYRRASRAAEPRGEPGIRSRAALGIGLAALLSGEAKDARLALTHAVELEPTSAPAHVGLGRYFAAIRRYHDAKVEFERAALLDPRSPDPVFQLGMAYVQAGAAIDAIRAFTAALERDPEHRPSREALKPLLEERYRAAGVPPEYAGLIERSSISRGELGVMLAVELGVDPARPAWRSDAPARPVPRDVEGAWGMPWLRAAAERGWLDAYPDGTLHVSDPVTRGALALLLAEVEYRARRSLPPPGAVGATAPALPAGVPDSLMRFVDLGTRHYLSRAAAHAVALGLPTREGGRFDAQAAVSGWEALRVLRALARRIGATSVLPPELTGDSMVR